jgi:hypothetical protein
MSRIPQHDRGAISILMVGVLVLASACVIGIAETSQHMVRLQHAVTAAEALAVAAAAGRDITPVLLQYDIVDHEVEHDGLVVIVRVDRNGVTAEASATNHRHTLERDS